MVSGMNPRKFFVAQRRRRLEAIAQRSLELELEIRELVALIATERGSISDVRPVLEPGGRAGMRAR